VIPAKVRACLAQMAELVDALGSGPSGGNTVEVRVLFWAPHLSPIAVDFRKCCTNRFPHDNTGPSTCF
jgi:hypothetical protein